MTKVGKAAAGEVAEEGMALMRGMLIAVCGFLGCLRSAKSSAEWAGLRLQVFFSQPNCDQGLGFVVQPKCKGLSAC
jgi:hypothetical protein